MPIRIVGSFDWTFAFDGACVASVMVISYDPVKLEVIGLNTSEFNGCYDKVPGWAEITNAWAMTSRRARRKGIEWCIVE